MITDQPKTIPSLTKFIIFSFAMLILFTIVVMVLEWLGVEVSDTLITCFYASFGGEVLMCALIKIFKLHNKEEEEND